MLRGVARKQPRWLFLTVCASNSLKTETLAAPCPARIWIVHLDRAARSACPCRFASDTLHTTVTRAEPHSRASTQLPSRAMSRRAPAPPSMPTLQQREDAEVDEEEEVSSRGTHAQNARQRTASHLRRDRSITGLSAVDEGQSSRQTGAAAVRSTYRQRDTVLLCAPLIRSCVLASCLRPPLQEEVSDYEPSDDEGQTKAAAAQAAAAGGDIMGMQAAQLYALASQYALSNSSLLNPSMFSLPTPAPIVQQATAVMNEPKRKGKWTAEQDSKLRETVAAHGGKNWSAWNMTSTHARVEPLFCCIARSLFLAALGFELMNCFSCCSAPAGKRSRRSPSV